MKSNREEAGRPGPGRAWPRAGLIVVSIVLISIAHYSTDTRLHLYHDVYRRLYYLPIFMAALWFGLKGGLGASLLCTALYAPHVIFQWRELPAYDLEKYLEILLFNIVGAVTGLLAERLKRQSELYRRASEDLERAYEALERRSSRLSLVEKQLRRTEKISALGELSATVAHELMNPLASIKGAVEIIKDGIEQTDEKHRFLSILIKEIERLDRTVRSVLRFQDQERISRRTCNPNEPIETILILMEPEARERGIEISKQLSPDVKSMELDSDKVQQVLLNVIINAIQAMPDGGRLTVRSAWRQVPPDRMDTGDLAKAEGILITVSDTGPGIPEDAREKIYEPFYSTKDEGTGLGLTITKKIVQAHGGRVCIENRPEGGTRLDIWLPNLQAREGSLQDA